MDTSESANVKYLELESDGEDDLDLLLNSEKNRPCCPKYKYIYLVLVFGLVVFSVGVYTQALPLLKMLKNDTTGESPIQSNFDDYNYDEITSSSNDLPDDWNWYEDPLPDPENTQWFDDDNIITELPTTTTTMAPFTPKYLDIDAETLYQIDAQVTKKTADYMLANMNTSVDPCDNFYTFACEGWIQRHNNQLEMGWDVLQDMENKSNAVYTAILEEPVNSSHLLAVNQARNLYQLCLKHVSLTKYGSEATIRDILFTLKTHGGWPLLYEKGTWTNERFGLYEIISLFIDNLLLTPLFSVTVHSPDSEIGYAHIQPAKPFLGKSTNDMTNSQIEDFIVNFSKAAVELGKLNITLDEGYVKQQAKKIVSVGRQLSTFVNTTWTDDMKNQTGFYFNFAELPWSKLLELVKETAGTKAMSQLKIFLDAFLDSNSDFIFYETRIYSVSDLNYLLKSLSLIASLSEEEFANYLMFQYIASKINSLSENNWLHASRRNVLNIMERPDSETCTESVLKTFRYALEHEYAKREFGSESRFQRIRDQVEYMFWNILQALKKLLANSSLKYNFEMIRKIDEAGICLGFSSWTFNATRVQQEYDGLWINETGLTYNEQLEKIASWSDRKADREWIETDYDTELNCDWQKYPESSGAFSRTDELKIYIPMGMLKAPVFELDRPMAVNFGSFGTVIGHEITHLFGKQGWETYDGLFNLLTSRGQCLRDQYESFMVADPISGEIMKDGTETVDEDFADNGSILEAFTAYKKENAKIKQKQRNFYGLEKYSDDQLFFLAFAQNWCESISDSGLVSFMRQFIHSPDAFRVLGTLRNSQEFADTWNCPVDSNMNLAYKCNIF